ncbi:MAG: protein kinase [Candidatus Nealsonbacteria bacterium]|nr:protein kinase [Candidatus Nealsonbacteria bacterium]
MRDSPPPQLTTLLEHLGLATAGQVAAVAPRVRRLARDLPRFESVWVDALAQARVLTPFQAAELNAGRGDLLRVGPYVLCGSLPGPAYLHCYQARHCDTDEPVRLAVAQYSSGPPEQIVERLQSLATTTGQLTSQHLAPVTEAGLDGQRIWVRSDWIEGRTAIEWLIHNGRFPSQIVLEIARAMLVGLVEMEQTGLCHGDVAASALLLTDAGGVVLLEPGVRGILRPEEGYAHTDLLPGAYDYLAPERIVDGTPPTVATDVYACGCVWWHLLCGRPPLSGGDALAKLRAGQMAKVFDLRQLAPDVPAELARAVEACLSRQPAARPESIARLAAMLGPPTRGAALAVARCAVRASRPATRWPASIRNPRVSWRKPLCSTAAAGCLIAAAVLWPVVRDSLSSPNVASGHSEIAPVQGVIGQRDTNSAGPDRVAAAMDNPVVAAAYEEPWSPPKPVDPPVSEPDGHLAEDLVLASDGPLRVASLDLQAGQRVCGSPGKRPVVMVPRAGLTVDVEDVRFENIDFVFDSACDSSSDGRSDSEETPPAERAIVHLTAGRAEFRGCTFRSAETSSPLPAAVRWTHPADAALSLPAGRIQFGNCVLRDVAAGVDCRTVGALTVEMSNVLHLGNGPLIRLDHAPRPDEPTRMILSQVTLRDSGPLLQCSCEQVDSSSGEISIRTDGCALVPRGGTALILLGGVESPEPMLRNVLWAGQGSLVSSEAVIAAWRCDDGRQQPLDDASVSIAGVVRSKVEFAGKAESDPAASRIIRWQAPLLSTDPPGFDPEGGNRLQPLSF